MRWLFGFLGGLFVFVGASCLVAEALHITVGNADGLFSLHDLWTSLNGPGLTATPPEGWLGLVWAPIAWLVALPSWLVFLALGGLLMLGSGGGRERTFG